MVKIPKQISHLYRVTTGLWVPFWFLAQIRCIKRPCKYTVKTESYYGLETGGGGRRVCSKFAVMEHQLLKMPEEQASEIDHILSTGEGIALRLSLAAAISVPLNLPGLKWKFYNSNNMGVEFFLNSLCEFTDGPLFSANKKHFRPKKGLNCEMHHCP